MEPLGGLLARIAGPGRTELPGERTFGLGTGEDEHPGVGISMPDHLEDEVRRGAEAGQPKVLPVLEAGQPQRPVADRAGAQERGGLRIGEDVGDPISKRLGHGHELGIAAVGVAAGRPELVAEVFLAPAAEAAFPACGEDPGDADPVAEPEAAGPRTNGRDPPDDLMAQDDRQPRRRRPSLDLVELGVADAAGVHLDQQLTLARNRIGQFANSSGRGLSANRPSAFKTIAHILMNPFHRDDLPETTPHAMLHRLRASTDRA